MNPFAKNIRLILEKNLNDKLQIRFGLLTCFRIYSISNTLGIHGSAVLESFHNWMDEGGMGAHSLRIYEFIKNALLPALNQKLIGARIYHFFVLDSIDWMID